MRTLLLPPSWPIESNYVAPTRRTEVGSGAYMTQRRYFKLYRWFRLGFRANDQYEQERLEELMAFCRLDTPFWFDGAGRGEITTPERFWDGDGVTKEFMLPFNNCFPPSWVFYENGVEKTDWTMVGEVGAITFTTAPEDESEITGSGIRQFKVKAMGEQDRLFDTDSEFAPQLYQQGVTLMEVP